MMVYREEEYLLLSGIQHFVLCRRQWALIHIEQQRAEKKRTVDEMLMHRHAQNEEFWEKRGSVIFTREMQVASAQLGVCGECDIVEFRRDPNGITFYDLDGTYRVSPVKYKRGEAKRNQGDAMQLCAQALCLEEMLGCEITEGALFCGENRRRIHVAFDDELRNRTRAVIAEMHDLYDRRYTPKVKRSRACNACPLSDRCLPMIASERSVSAYIAEMMGELE